MKYQSKSHLFLPAMKADIKAERLVAGDPNRCWIGCAVREYNHDKMANELGWPLSLVRIGETIFEGLNKADGQKFAVDILAAPKHGVDLTLVHWKFLHWMLEDTIEKYGTPEVRKGCADAIAVVRDMANGMAVDGQRAARAARAAYAAACAADAAAGAAAGAAAYAAACAADAARAADAACAARAADAACAAGSSYKEFADKLIELLKAET